jgi:hypothetical protein
MGILGEIVHDVAVLNTMKELVRRIETEDRADAIDALKAMGRWLFGEFTWGTPSEAEAYKELFEYKS